MWLKSTTVPATVSNFVDKKNQIVTSQILALTIYNLTPCGITQK